MSRKRRPASRPRPALPPAGSHPAAVGGTGGPLSGPGFFRRNRREVTFLALFVVLLGGSFTLISLNWINDHAIEPFTGGIARLSGAVLNLLGQHVALRGTVIQGPHFAVNIRNGCNGVEAMMVLASAMLAFPATFRSRLAGLLAGSAAIQILNLVRVSSLVWLGEHHREFFDFVHVGVWQSIVILAAVVMFVFWSWKFAEKPLATRS